MKIRPAEDELLHAYKPPDRHTDGRTDRHDKNNIPFSQFCLHP